jgi:CRISPR/Cas system-associated endoribonuclease Cas2
LAALADHLIKKRPGAPVKKYSAMPVGLREMFFSPKLSTSISSKDIEKIFVSGEFDISKLSQADVSGEPGSYTISRSKNAYTRAGNNATGSTPILVNSDIGNGKTVFACQIGYYYAQKKYRVFEVQREPENIGEILDYFEALDEPALVIFDDLMRFRTLPSAILEMKRSNIIVLATVRTGLRDTVPHSIKSRIGHMTAIEIDLDVMMRHEAVQTLRYLDVNALLGRFADLGDNERLEFIEKTCGGQFRDIVLSLYETGALHKKVEQLLINVQKLDKEAQDLIIFSAVLTQAGFHELSQLSLLTDILDYSGVFEDLRNALTEHELISLVRLDAGDITIRSPILAEFILRRVFNIETILDVVKRGLRAIHNYYADEYDLVRMAKGLLKFSVYGRIIKGNKENEIIERFYDDCRLLSFAADDPLFWVQRSICNLNSNEFEICFRYIENAYGLARKRINWDTYQIDDHLARVLLTQSKEEGVSVDGERERRAQSLLQSVLARKSDNLYHPLSVMRLYSEIVDKYLNDLTTKQKVALKGAIESAISSIARFKHTDRFRNLPELRTRLTDASRRLN